MNSLGKGDAWIFSKLTLYGTVFWIGRMHPSGDPITSPDRQQAFPFASAWGAMQCAETHNALRNSPDWRVVKR